MIVMPAMSEAATESWFGLLDLYDLAPEGWTLIGGQLVHLHCAERRYSPLRPTQDGDAVVDIRQVEIFVAVTAALRDYLKFMPDPSADGVQHRWRKDKAVIDMLIPEGAGPRAEARKGASGFPTVAAPGGTQALHRSEVVQVQVRDRTGSIPRPTLLGAMVLKAAARIETTGTGRDRHCHDFATLSALISSGDIRENDLSKKDRKRLRDMVTLTRETPGALDAHPQADRRLTRLAEIVQ